MKVQNELKNRTIEVIVAESIKEDYPSYRLEVGLDTEIIKGSFRKHIWISLGDLENFISSLNELDKTRKGQAEIQGMSPGEFTLYFRAIDNLGHLAVGINLLEEDRIANDYSYDIKVEFQVDPTILPSVISDLRKIIE
ncbi:hypothetical protein [Rufibacter sp. DG15C]|uniref:WapI family immunity protein n=1 Tax=Rufibacter sp. DG15C TaxID=1379909 RepID=UPI000835954B|nr:hypothetical protein [Rufibacter sp. DG15C]